MLPLLRSRLLLAAACLLALPALPAAAAPAVPDGLLGVVPATGNDQVRATFTTAGPCPEGTQETYVLLLGGPLPPEGQVVRDVGAAGLSTEAAFSVEGSRTWRDTALAAGVVDLTGDYRVELSCVTRIGQRLATFTSPLTFTAPDAYTAPADVVPVVAVAPPVDPLGDSGADVPQDAVVPGAPAVPGSPVPGAGAPGAEVPGPLSSGGPGSGGTGAPGPGAPATATVPAASAEPTGGGVSPVLAALLGGVAVAAVALGLSRLRRAKGASA